MLFYYIFVQFSEESKAVCMYVWCTSTPVETINFTKFQEDMELENMQSKHVAISCTQYLICILVLVRYS